MNRLIKSCALLLLIGTIAVSSLLLATEAQSNLCQIQGYVTDSNGNPVVNAYVNFNGVIPNGVTNSQGYYSTKGPPATYQFYVWPLFDSNYIYYAEPSLVVSSSVTKNVTLSIGCKVSGYVTNSSGTPMVGASVLFKVGSAVYSSGWFTNAQGYYYINVPAGTYTIDAHPQTAYNPNYTDTCTPFKTYLENNFAVSTNISKNIIVDNLPTTPTPAPTSTPVPQPTAQPTQVPTTASTPTPQPLPPTTLTITTEATAYQVGTTLNVQGCPN